MNITCIKRIFNASFPLDKNKFNCEIYESNFKVFKITLFFVLFSQVLNLYHVIFLSNSGLSSFKNRIYFYLYLSLFLITLISLTFLYLSKNFNYFRKKSTLFFFVYSFIFCLWSSGITTMDFMTQSNITVYTISSLSIAILIYLKPSQSIFLFSINYLILIILLPVYKNPELNILGDIINITILSFVSLFISVSRYYSKCNDFNNRYIIMMQNHKMTKMNTKLNKLVVTDNLSGLNNRRFLDSILSEEWIEKSSTGINVGVIMLDIDNFKNYNDIYGHQKGDVCIQKISNILKEISDNENSYSIRYGGEEFTLIIFNIDKKNIIEIAENILKNVYELNLENLNTKYTYVTLSEGICFGKINSDLNLYDFIKKADDALYRSKNSGKNKYTLYEI